MTRIRVGLVPGLLLVLALALAACGGGDGNSGGVASLGGAGGATSTTSVGGRNELQAALNWARCMRQHGVNVPDPQLTADGIVQQPLIPKSTKARAAERACRQYLRNGGQPAALTAQERQRALALARCVREHGISDMPDPQFTGNRLVQDGPPSMEDDDPRLTAARSACEQFLPAHKRGGRG